MRIADYEGPHFLHIYEYNGSFICQNTQHHATFHKLYPSSGKFVEIHLKKETVSKTQCDVCCDN